MAIELVTGHAGSAHVSSADVGAFNAGVFGRGNYVISDAPTVDMSDANTATITACDLLLQGRHVRLSGTNSIAISNGVRTADRIDLVCSRYTYDPDTGVETSELVVIEGEPGRPAKEPALQNTTSVLEGASVADVAIARVLLSGLAPSIEWLLPKLSGTNDDLAALRADIANQNNQLQSSIGGVNNRVNDVYNNLSSINGTLQSIQQVLGALQNQINDLNNSKVNKINLTPIYRVYNANAGEHHFTQSVSERDRLLNVGWRDEGIGFYGVTSNG